MKTWAAWQAPYMLRSYAYVPVTFARRVLRQGGAGWRGEDLAARQFWDKWGSLPRGLPASGRAGGVWINMNSGGEVIIAWSLLRRLRVDAGPYVLSTESYDAYELLAENFGRERVFFPPWDHWLPVRRHLTRLAPRALVFVQNAYFPTLLREAKRAGVATVLVNGLFTRNVLAGNPFMQRAVALGFHRHLDMIAVQSMEDHDAARALGVPRERLAVTGDMYADIRDLRLSVAERGALRRELSIADTDRVVVAGSTHIGEEPVITEVFRRLRAHDPSIRLIVAPRQLHETPEFARRLEHAGWAVQARTALRTAPPDPSRPYDVLMLDTFGELRRVLGVADAAYIGATLVPFNERRAGHNVLEPLVHGVVPVFGPHLALWRHVADRLLKADPGLEVDSPEALATRLVEVLDGVRPLAAIRATADEILAEQSGALQRTVDVVEQTLGLR